MHDKRYRQRRASVLVVVLLAVTMVSLLAYYFADSMVLETVMCSEHQRDASMRWTCRSGVEYSAWALDESKDKNRNIHSNPKLFQGQAIKHRTAKSTYFSVLSIHAPDENENRFGLFDESGKLNVNSLDLRPQVLEESRARLVRIPGVTIQIADAILDFIDADESPRPFGAESSYYQSISTELYALNRPLESLDELLLVRGITAELLYGEDGNGNGWLDPNENDGKGSLPIDNSDGKLDAGLSRHLTVLSRESNISNELNPKINLNQSDLAKLYDELAQEFGDVIARFVVAYRMEGSIEREKEATSERVKLTVSQRELAARQRAREQLGLEEDEELFRESKIRSGIELRPASYRIRSLFDLFGVSTLVEIKGEDRVLDSPWPLHSEAIEVNFPILENKLTLADGRFQLGRINVKEATLPVLLSIPGMDQSLAESIVYAARNVSEETKSLGWLVRINNLDSERLRKIGPYITASGDLFRACVVAEHPKSARKILSSVILDRTFQPCRVTTLQEQSFSAPHSWFDH